VAVLGPRVASPAPAKLLRHDRRRRTRAELLQLGEALAHRLLVVGFCQGQGCFVGAVEASPRRGGTPPLTGELGGERLGDVGGGVDGDGRSSSQGQHLSDDPAGAVRRCEVERERRRLHDLVPATSEPPRFCPGGGGRFNAT
jgi:hypothetical protein